MSKKLSKDEWAEQTAQLFIDNYKWCEYSIDEHTESIETHSKSIDALTARVADLSRQCQALAGIMESASHRISKLERPRPWYRRLATLWPFSTER